MHFCFCGWNKSTWFNLWYVNNNIWLWFVFILGVSLLAFFLSYDTIVGFVALLEGEMTTANFSFDFSFFLFAGRFVNLLCVVWDAHLPWFIKLFHFLPLESWFYFALKQLYCLLFAPFHCKLHQILSHLQRRCLHPLQVEAVYRSNLISFTYRSPKWTCIHFILLLCKTEVTDTLI